MGAEIERILIEILVAKAQAEKDLKDITSSVNKTIKQIRKTSPDVLGGLNKNINVSKKEIAAAMKQVELNNTKLTKEIEQKQRESTTRTLQWGLSFLFTGMAIKRVFQGIATSSFAAYNKLTANTAMANSATNKLNMSFDYLKFTIADALNTAITPLLPMLESWIEFVANLVEDHPKLVTWIIGLGIVLGTVGMIVGQFGLGLLGLKAAFGKLGAISVASFFGGIGLSGLGTEFANLKKEVGLAGLSVSDFKETLGRIVQFTISVAGIIKGVNMLTDDNLKNDIWGAILVGVGAMFGANAILGQSIGGLIFAGYPVLGTILLGIGIGFTIYAAIQSIQWLKKEMRNTPEMKAIRNEIENQLDPITLLNSDTSGNIGSLDYKNVDLNSIFDGRNPSSVISSAGTNNLINQVSQWGSVWDNFFTGIGDTKSTIDIFKTNTQKIGDEITESQKYISTTVNTQKEIVSDVNSNLAPLASEDFKNDVNGITTSTSTIDTNFEKMITAQEHYISKLNKHANKLNIFVGG